MKKLSFAINSKPSTSSSSLKPKPTQNDVENGDEDKKHFVTEFDPTLDRNSNTKPLHVIPPKENEWRPVKRMKNIDLPLHPDYVSMNAASLQFELASSGGDSITGVDDKISYGLNLRQIAEEEGGATIGARKDTDLSYSGTENVLLEKLKFDLERLPDDEGFDEFKDVPVEGFGAALLAGYGWYEGRGIGKNAKEDVKVRQYTKRNAMEGLGFVSTDTHKPTTGNNRDDVVNNGVVSNKDSGSKHREKIRSDRDDKDRFNVGDGVRVIGGKRESVIGSKAMVVERLDLDRVVVRLAKSEEEVKVCVSDVVGLGSKEEDVWFSKVNASREKSNSKDNGKKHVEEKRESVKRNGSNSRDNGKRHVDEEKDSAKKNSRGSKMDRVEERVAWLRNHIRVKIISKQLKGGKLYLKKGKVVDVAGPYVCDISMDESNELVQGVDQDLLETALPHRGGPILVLYGKHKGVYGSLVQRDLDREIAVVQDSDTQELVNVKLDQIAEYTGDPSDIGY